MERGRVKAMSYGPHGIVRTGGKVVFLRRVAPGDEVEFEIREDHGTYAFGEVVRVLAPSPLRREPPCPYLPRCGGCPWQHLTYAAQLAAKQRNLEEHLRRIAKEESPPLLPPLAAPEEFRYRHRLSLRIEGKQVGFFAAASHDLVPVEHCLLGNETVNTGFAPAAEFVRGTSLRLKRVEFVAEESGPHIAFAFEAEGSWVESEEKKIAEWSRTTPGLRGVVVRGRGWRRVWGEPTVNLEVAPGCTITVEAGAFSQVAPAANRLLVQLVLERLASTADATVVDAYCGAGNFTLPLAKRGARVIAIEQDPVACANLRTNLQQAGLSARVIEATAEAALRQLVGEQVRVQAVLLDPPRGGAAGTLPSILALRPQRVVYVSCHSAALARDLAKLRPHYRLESVQLLDLFPQTYHAEAVATLVPAAD
jgi:23S rRNA (uracil1939-C5)-methyltransferase